MVQIKAKNQNNRFTLDMSPELRVRLKIAAARKGITMREYSLSAIETRLNQDELQVLIPGRFTRESVKQARAFQEATFGKRGLPDDSAELIRQAREERAKRLD